MKRILVLIFCAVLMISSIPCSYAVETCTYRNEWVMENGVTVVEEIIFENDSRATDKAGTRRLTYSDEDQNLMAIIAMRVVFRYDGTNVRVISKSMTQTDTYNGWSYEHNSFVTVGGKVTTKFYLSKSLYSQLFSFSLTCDKDGNLS